MIIVSYDFENNKRRSIFSKYLKSYGHRIQYSVFEIRNSQRILKNILNEVELRYKKDFKNCDSVIILNLCEQCKKKVIRYGCAENEISEILKFE